MELGNDPIIGFRTRGNATAVDYRGEMALKATEISALRAMSANVEDTEEFNVVLASLIRMIFVLAGDSPSSRDESVIEVGWGTFSQQMKENSYLKGKQ